MSKLNTKTLKDLQTMAKNLKIVGVYHFNKDELIEVIQMVNSEAKTKAAPKRATVVQLDPITILADQLDVDRALLKEARKRLYKETTESGIESAKNEILAAENKVRASRKALKATKKAARKEEDFSWGALIGIGALVIAAAGAGVGAAVLLDNGSEAEVSNGDSL